jgi:hypothetical protein
LKYKYQGRTQEFSGKCHFYKIKKMGWANFSGAGMIIYQLSLIGLNSYSRKRRKPEEREREKEQEALGHIGHLSHIG